MHADEIRTGASDDEEKKSRVTDGVDSVLSRLRLEWAREAVSTGEWCDADGGKPAEVKARDGGKAPKRG